MHTHDLFLSFPVMSAALGGGGWGPVLGEDRQQGAQAVALLGSVVAPCHQGSWAERAITAPAARGPCSCRCPRVWSRAKQASC